jgi:hypothetical protein
MRNMNKRKDQRNEKKGERREKERERGLMGVSCRRKTVD